MPLTDLQHFLLQVADLDATRDWYVDVLGLEEGPHPDFGFPVRWLYLSGKDVLHLTAGGAGVSEQRRRYVGQQSQAVEGTGVVDHVAFGATGLDAMIQRLRARGVAFTERRADLVAAYQLFLLDPNGVKVELNFPASEAAGRTTEVMAGVTES
ncbi:MAG: VOC family protein [Thalassobaculum sp.]|uniref:VOC family protein n=1 Tax=Thalassobaculum sp. TaxID=2022740 RepID=UPI0032EBABFC